MIEIGVEFDPVRSVEMISENRNTLLFVLERYFHPKTRCADPARTCPRIADTFRLLARNLAREERMMAEAGYPDIAEHRCEHQKLLTRLEQMRTELTCSEYDNRQVADFLYGWTKRHARTFDAEFATFCRERHFRTVKDGDG